MKLNNLSFPYPIISSTQEYRDDYVDSSYQTSHDNQTNIEENQFKFEFTHWLSSPDISSLIDKKMACFAVQVYCKSTLINKIFTSFERLQTVELPLKHLFGSFSLTPQIIALERIKNYSPSDLHEEFGDSSFELSPGDVLAHDAVIELQCDFEQLALESLVKVLPSEHLEPTVYEIAITDYYIEIYMGIKAYEVWASLAADRQNTGPFIHMSIYKDLNYHVLNEIVQEPENQDKIWGKAWLRRLAELGLVIPEGAGFIEINRLAQLLVAKDGMKRLQQRIAKENDE
jgi:hypothetical protein